MNNKNDIISSNRFARNAACERLKSAVAVLALSGLPVLAGAAAEPWPIAVLSPSGDVGAINHPTSDVLPWGGMSLGLSHDHPELERMIPVGHFCSMKRLDGTLRGADRCSVGLETRVGGENRLTPGYGRIPRLRHGLPGDVTDHDRNGVDLVASSPRWRGVLNQPLGC